MSGVLESGAQTRRVSAGKQLMHRAAEFRELALIVALAASILLMSQLSANFLTTGNLRAVVIGMVPGAIIAVGMAVLLASGGFDLSVAAVMALCGTVAAWLVTHGVGTAGSIGLTLLLGCLIGGVNGGLVTFLGVNPLVATLGTLSVARGLALVMTEGYNISGLPTSFTRFGEAGPLELPWMVWIAVVIVLAGDLALRHTRFLRQVYYLGENERAARLSGIRVQRLRVFTYVASGALAAFAGELLAARLNAATPTAATGLELTVIAAAVIGGASLTGGQGTVLGAVLGVAFLALVANALTLMQVSIFWQEVATGVILVAAVSLDMLVRRRRRAE